MRECDITELGNIEGNGKFGEKIEFCLGHVKSECQYDIQVEVLNGQLNILSMEFRKLDSARNRNLKVLSVLEVHRQRGWIKSLGNECRWSRG